MSEYTINDSSNCLNTRNSYNNTALNNCTSTDDLSPPLKWLSPLDPGLRNSDIQGHRVGKVEKWLMGTEKSRRWYGLGGKVDDGKAVLLWKSGGSERRLLSNKD